MADSPQSGGSGERCHASRDGDCLWEGCPQEADGRANYQSLCPLVVDEPEDEWSMDMEEGIGAAAFIYDDSGYDDGR